MHNGAWVVFANACIKVTREERAPLVDLFHSVLQHSAVSQAHQPEDRLASDSVNPRSTGGVFMGVQILRAWRMAG